VKPHEIEKATFRNWLVMETWVSGDLLRRQRERGAEKFIMDFQAGKHDGFVQSLSKFADRDPAEIRAAGSLDDLCKIVMSGPSFLTLCAERVQDAYDKQKENGK
jgi:hypothetical protein